MTATCFDKRIEVKYSINTQAGVTIKICVVTPDQPVQELRDGKFVTVRFEDDIEVVLLWGQRFDFIEDAERFVNKDRLFKKVFKQIKTSKKQPTRSDSSFLHYQWRRRIRG